MITLTIVAALMPHEDNEAGEIYKWIGADGRTQFSDHPPQRLEVETVDIRINTYTGPPTVSSNGLYKTPDESKARKKVIIYTTTWCGVCKKAKSYFKAHDIPYQEYDVESSEKGRRDYKKLKGRGVPIILVGNRRMNGFGAKNFNKMYN
jgi:glutaredoxin